MKSSTLQAFWAGVSFLLVSVVFLPIHIAFSDIFGRKPILYSCVFFFVLGAVIVGTAKSGVSLVVGRTIQGVGAGGLEALSEVILTDLTTLKERPKYLGLLGLMFAGGSILGPVVGGLFAQYTTWRWIAWINFPLVGIAMIPIPPFLKLATDDSPWTAKAGRVDWFGILYFTTGLTCFILAIVGGGQLSPWNSWQILLPLALGITLLLVFAFQESRTPNPIISPELFNTSTRSMALIGATIHGILLFSILYYLPIYFEGVIQHRPLRAVVDSLPLAFTVTSMSIVCALLIELSRRYVWTVWVGWLLSTIGLATMVLLAHDTPSAEYNGLQIATGLGMGILYPALTIPLQAASTADDAGVATGILVFFRALGSVIGVSLCAAIFSNRFQNQLPGLNLPPALGFQDASKAIDFIPRIQTLNITAEAKISLLEIYADSLKYIWVALASLSGIGLFSTLFIKELTLEKDDRGRQAFQGRA